MEKESEEKKEIKKPNYQLIVGVCLIIFVLILGGLFFKITKERTECEGNPFVYGAKKTAEQGLEIICTCIPLDPKFAGFIFDKYDLSIQEQIVDLTRSLNLSLNP